MHTCKQMHTYTYIRTHMHARMHTYIQAYNFVLLVTYPRCKLEVNGPLVPIKNLRQCNY